MAQKANAFVVGRGDVGMMLIKLLEVKGHRVKHSLRAKDGLFAAEKRIKSWQGPPSTDADLAAFLDPNIDAVNVAFIAIPTHVDDEGRTAMRYIDYFLSRNIPVVTCEKGALSHHFGRLKPHLGRIGYAATVGGGTDMIECLRRRQLQDADAIVYVVLNGTLNKIWDQVVRGEAFDSAVAEAQALRYAEPNGSDSLGIVNGELRDIRMKIAVLYNLAFANPGGPFLTASYSSSAQKGDGFVSTALSEDDIQHLTSWDTRYRYVVTFASIPDYNRGYAGGSNFANPGRWEIKGSFQNIKALSPTDIWLQQLPDVFNGFHIKKSGSKDTGHFGGGPGAGPETTAEAMIRDMNRLLNQ